MNKSELVNYWFTELQLLVEIRELLDQSDAQDNDNVVDLIETINERMSGSIEQVENAITNVRVEAFLNGIELESGVTLTSAMVDAFVDFADDHLASFDYAPVEFGFEMDGGTDYVLTGMNVADMLGKLAVFEHAVVKKTKGLVGKF